MPLVEKNGNEACALASKEPASYLRCEGRVERATHLSPLMPPGEDHLTYLVCLSWSDSTRPHRQGSLWARTERLNVLQLDRQASPCSPPPRSTLLLVKRGFITRMNTAFPSTVPK